MIPDYLIYDEMKRREEAGRETLVPLHLPLYRVPPGWGEPAPDESEAEDTSGGSSVIIIDMETGMEL